jgi:hypothetical protein
MEKFSINILDGGAISFKGKIIRCPTKFILTNHQEIQDLETILRIKSMEYEKTEIKEKIVVPRLNNPENKTIVPTAPCRPSRFKELKANLIKKDIKND